ncbi:MAG: hypothetical protein M0Z41_05080 [Peptococcaceae bacterium]|nr:hypothetical protein [Peptococcaceae bacterium]
MRKGVRGLAGGATLSRMDVFLAVGSLVLFLAALILALAGRPGTEGRPAGAGARRRVGRDVTLVRGRDFFERGEGPRGS